MANPNPQMDSLYELIHTLNRSEKRYFKIFAAKESRGESSKYLQLFEALDAMQPYNKERVRKLYAEERWKPNVSRVKNYLSNLILKSLSAFSLEKNSEQKIWELIGQFHILRRKGLWKHAGKVLAKAEKMSERFEQLTMQLEIFHCRREMLRNETNLLNLDAELELLREKYKRVAVQYGSEFEYACLSLRIHVFHRQQGAVRTPEQQRELDAFYHHPLLQDESLAETNRARFYYHSLKASHAIAGFDYATAYHSESRLLDLLVKFPDSVTSRPQHHCSRLRNLLLLLCYQERYAEGLERLALLNETTTAKFGLRPNNDTASEHFAYASCCLIFLAGVGMTEEGARELEGFSNWVESFRQHVHPFFFLSFLYGAGLLCFTAGDFEGTRTWLKPLLESDWGAERSDLKCMAQLLLLLIQLEEGDFEGVEKAYPNVMRKLRNQGMLQALERNVLQWIKLRLKWGVRTRQYQGELQALYEQTRENLEEARERPVLLLFDFRYYLRAELERRPFQEVLRDKLL